MPTGSAQSIEPGNGGKPLVWFCPEITKICLPGFLNLTSSHACLVCFHWYKSDTHNYSPLASNVFAKLSKLAKLPLTLCLPTKFLFPLVTNYCITRYTVILLIHCDIFETVIVTWKSPTVATLIGGYSQPKCILVSFILHPVVSRPWSQVSTVNSVDSS